MPTTVKRLGELGMPRAQAQEIVSRFTAGTSTAAGLRRLVESGIPPRLSREINRQASTTKNAPKLVELGMIPGIAKEVVS